MPEVLRYHDITYCYWSGGATHLSFSSLYAIWKRNFWSYLHDAVQEVQRQVYVFKQIYGNSFTGLKDLILGVCKVNV